MNIYKCKSSLAVEVLQAYAVTSNSMTPSLTSLEREKEDLEAD